MMKNTAFITKLRKKLGQSEFSHKELHNKSCNDIQDMLMIQKNINWNNLETTKKRGSCCIRNKNEIN